MKLEAVRAVVTGAAGGLGASFCRHLAAAGAQVVASDYNPQSLNATFQSIQSPSFHTIKADVTSEKDVAHLFQEARQLMGGCNKTGEVKTLSRENWEAVINTNLTGPFLCAREFASGAIEAKEEAVIVNMSSLARHGNVGQSSYSAAKAGLAADTVVWARELARYKIRVGAIAPGIVNTSILDSIPPELKESMIQTVPVKRLGEPEDIWLGVRFIIECDYFTGRVVDIDGGLSF